MIRGNIFRPWGLYNNVFQSAPKSEWGFLGSISSEERSTAFYTQFIKENKCHKSIFFQLNQERSRYSTQANSATATNYQSLIRQGVAPECFVQHDLNAPFNEYANFIDELIFVTGNSNLVIDITSMPKRLFFYSLRQALSTKSKLANVVVTYTEPEGYGKDALAENQRRWAPLPGFSGPKKIPHENKVIIGIGFEPLGLPELVATGEFEGSQISLLFPFPSQPDRVAKNWKFARDLFPNINTDIVSIHRVDGVNVPEIFDSISRIGNFGDIHLKLAPFGPKPISLGMALYASKYSKGDNATSVFYTQPTIYNPNYSSGINYVNGCPAINCYCVRIDGKNLY